MAIQIKSVNELLVIAGLISAAYIVYKVSGLFEFSNPFDSKQNTLLDKTYPENQKPSPVQDALRQKAQELSDKQYGVGKVIVDKRTVFGGIFG